MKSIKAKCILIVIYAAFCSLSFVCDAKAENTELKKLYDELMEFKDDPEFHKVGFGVCCKYNKWQLRVKALKNNTNLTMLEKVAAGDLLMLGLEYMETKGKENDYTKFAREAITDSLK